MAQQLALSEAALNQTQQMIAANQLRMENLKKQMAGTQHALLPPNPR
jgi:hypothetical protein